MAKCILGQNGETNIRPFVTSFLCYPINASAPNKSLVNMLMVAFLVLSVDVTVYLLTFCVLLETM